MSAAFPGLLHFYVEDATAEVEGVVIGWADGFLVVMTDDRRLVRVDPDRAKVTGQASFKDAEDKPLLSAEERALA